MVVSPNIPYCNVLMVPVHLPTEFIINILQSVLEVHNLLRLLYPFSARSQL
jgi:hypothetical protein